MRLRCFSSTYAHWAGYLSTSQCMDSDRSDRSRVPAWNFTAWYRNGRNGFVLIILTNHWRCSELFRLYKAAWKNVDWLNWLCSRYIPSSDSILEKIFSSYTYEWRGNCGVLYFNQSLCKQYIMFDWFCLNGIRFAFRHKKRPIGSRPECSPYASLAHESLFWILHPHAYNIARVLSYWFFIEGLQYSEKNKSILKLAACVVSRYARVFSCVLTSCSFNQGKVCVANNVTCTFYIFSDHMKALR